MSKLEEKSISVTRVASLADDVLLQDMCLEKFKLSEHLFFVCVTSSYLHLLVLVYMSPEAITAKFWRNAISHKLKDVLSFIAIDEVHLIEDWGATFRPSYKELNFIRSCQPSIPLMALSATAPTHLIFSITRELNMFDYVLVSAPLNRPNLFFSLDSSHSMFSVFSSLSSMLSSTNSPESIPKTLIFCRSKDTLYNVYVYLIRSCNNATKGYVGQYHATMTLQGRSQHYRDFKSGRQRVMVATSAFGLGIDINDITEVILFSVPNKGSELVQLAGRGGRDPRRLCLVRFVVRPQDLRDSDSAVVKLASNTACLRKVILREILQSEEHIHASDFCCSFCSSVERPSAFSLELPSASTVSCSSHRSGTLRSRRILAVQRAALKKNLVEFRGMAGGTRFKRRGLDGVLSMAVIDNVLKKCNRIISEDDVQSTGVMPEFTTPVYQMIERHIPITIPQSVPTVTRASRSIASCRESLLEDITNCL